MSASFTTIPMELIGEDLRQKLERSASAAGEPLVLTLDGKSYRRICLEPVEEDAGEEKTLKSLLLSAPRGEPLDLPERRVEPMRDLNL